MTAIKQIGGTHYEAAYQHWDMVDDLDLGYLEGQITKYVMRSRKKNGVQDIQKAQTFLERLVKRARRKGPNHVIRPAVVDDILALFFANNVCTPTEVCLIRMAVCWRTIADLDILRRRLGDHLQVTLSAMPKPNISPDASHVRRGSDSLEETGGSGDLEPARGFPYGG